MAGLECYLPPELAEEYEPLALLKEGDRRQTVLLQNRRSGERAVLKRSLDDLDRPEEEYRLLKELAGEGIPAGYRCFQNGGASYLLREYIPGDTLLDYLQKKGTLSVEETAGIGVTLCRILGRLHSQTPPVIHRDIKAENLIRTPNGELYLIDFGIARRYENGAQQDTQILGTPFSAPPEQFGYRQTDPRSDIYSVGCLLHELVTGEPRPDRGEDPAPLRGIIRKCVSFDPEKRYSSVSTLERALKRVPVNGTRKRRYFVGAAILVAILLAALLLWTARPRESGDRYSFADPAIEAEVCRQLGKEPGTVTAEDLEQVTAILLCGDVPFEEWDQMILSGEWLTLNGVGPMSSENRGTVSSLADIPNLPNLKQLALCYQEIEDLSPLTGCSIERLALPGNRVSDLSPLGGVYLQQLYLNDNSVTDLSPLASCTGLWRINLGATGVSDLSPLAELPYLNTLELAECSDLDLAGLDELTLEHLTVNLTDPAQLEHVTKQTGLWYLALTGWDQMDDLTGLSSLTGLQWIYLDMHRLSSLEGVQALTGLEHVDIRSDIPVDVTPLASLPQLWDLTVTGFQVRDWSPLARMTGLKRVTCRADQEEAIREAVAGRDVALNVTG